MQSHNPALKSNHSLLLSLGTIPNPLTLMHFSSALLFRQLNVRGVKRGSTQSNDAFVSQRVINLGNALLKEAKEGLVDGLCVVTQRTSLVASNS